VKIRSGDEVESFFVVVGLFLFSALELVGSFGFAGAFR